MLPEGWSNIKIGDAAQLAKSKYDPRNDSSDLSCVELEHIAANEGRILGTVPASSLNSIKNRFSIGDILFGKLRPYLKKYAKPDFSGVCSTEIWVLSPRQEKLSTDYLLQTVQHRPFLEAANKSCGTKMPRAEWSVVSATEILLPPLPEQRRIAEILGSVDAAIEATKAVIEQTKTVKLGLLQTLLTRGIGHTKFKDSPLGEIPESWEVTTLDQLAAKNGLQTGPFGSQLHAADYTDEGTPVVMPKNIVNGRVVTDGIARVPDEIVQALKRHTSVEGDILFGRRGDIGRCCLISLAEVGYLCGTGCLRFRPNKFKIDPRYLIHFLQNDHAIAWLNENAVGQTMLNLNTGILAALPILVPPLPEQRQIADCFECVENKIFSEAAKLTSLQTLKKGLMNDLLTGKVRVNLPEKATA